MKSVNRNAIDEQVQLTMNESNEKLAIIFNQEQTALVEVLALMNIILLTIHAQLV